MKFEIHWFDDWEDNVQHHYSLFVSTREQLPSVVSRFLARQNRELEVFSVTDESGAVVLTEDDFIEVPLIGDVAA